MNEYHFSLITPRETTNYQKLLAGKATASWPAFMLHDRISDELWDNLYSAFPKYQFALIEDVSGRVAAMANSLALHWDGDPMFLPEGGWDWAFQQAVNDHAHALQPRTQCAIQIAIHPDYRGLGLSGRMVRQMCEIGRVKGFKRLIAPVRPNQKSLFPLIEIDQYINWKTNEGLPYDAWLRVHVRAGAKIIKPCHQAMEIRGTRSQWQAWTGLEFPGNGEYILPGGLVPMKMDVESDQGVYLEPNVWTVHNIT